MKRIAAILLALVLAVPVYGDIAGNKGGGLGTGGGSYVLCKGVNATTTGTSEQVLATCPLYAGQISTDGTGLLIYMFWHTAATPNNKQVRVRLGGIGGALAWDSGPQALNNRNFTPYEPLFIQRLSATTATTSGKFTDTADKNGAAGTANMYYSDRALAVTWGNQLDLVITATTPTVAGDIIFDSWMVIVFQ